MKIIFLLLSFNCFATLKQDVKSLCVDIKKEKTMHRFCKLKIGKQETCYYGLYANSRFQIKCEVYDEALKGRKAEND